MSDVTLNNSIQLSSVNALNDLNRGAHSHDILSYQQCHSSDQIGEAIALHSPVIRLSLTDSFVVIRWIVV
jgi:hypothetical protein